MEAWREALNLMLQGTNGLDLTITFFLLGAYQATWIPNNTFK